MQTFVAVPGGSLFCERAGSGKAVVFIHGFSLDNRMWNPQFSVFSEHFTAVRYDVRGFGKSSLPGGPYDHGNDLSALMEALGIRSAAVVGLSMGGAIAINFAMSYPGKLRSLVLADSSIGYLQPSREAVSFGRKIPSSADSEYLAEVKRMWLNDGVFKPAFKSPELRREIFSMVDDYSGFHWLHENPVATIDLPYREKLRKIDTPTLVIVGALDVPKHQHVADLLAGAIPGAVKAVITGAGHMSNMERPDEFNRIVLSFLC